MAKRLSFEIACATFVHRYTAEHVPLWGRRRPVDDGGTDTRFYAPQFLTDREWYDNTVFPGEPGNYDRKHCFTSNQSWPYGMWLDAPFDPRNPPARKP